MRPETPQETSTSLQFRLLQREVELMSHFTVGIIEELEAAERDGASREDRLALVRALISASLKLSRLLWPFGRRAGDELNIEEAGRLRYAFGYGDDHPLSPASSLPLAAALALRNDELMSIIDWERRTVRVEGGERPLLSLSIAIRDVYERTRRRG